jgi:hypothetical protein
MRSAGIHLHLHPQVQARRLGDATLRSMNGRVVVLIPYFTNHHRLHHVHLESPAVTQHTGTIRRSERAPSTGAPTLWHQQTPW